MTAKRSTLKDPIVVERNVNDIRFDKSEDALNDFPCRKD
jgi:hypothetical protein